MGTARATIALMASAQLSLRPLSMQSHTMTRTRALFTEGHPYPTPLIYFCLIWLYTRPTLKMFSGTQCIHQNKPIMADAFKGLKRDFGPPIKRDKKILGKYHDAIKRSTSQPYGTEYLRFTHTHPHRLRAHCTLCRRRRPCCPQATDPAPVRHTIIAALSHTAITPSKSTRFRAHS